MTLGRAAKVAARAGNMSECAFDFLESAMRRLPTTLCRCRPDPDTHRHVPSNATLNCAVTAAQHNCVEPAQPRDELRPQTGVHDHAHHEKTLGTGVQVATMCNLDAPSLIAAMWHSMHSSSMGARGRGGEAVGRSGPQQPSTLMRAQPGHEHTIGHIVRSMSLASIHLNPPAPLSQLHPRSI